MRSCTSQETGWPGSSTPSDNPAPPNRTGTELWGQPRPQVPGKLPGPRCPRPAGPWGLTCLAWPMADPAQLQLGGEHRGQEGDSLACQSLPHSPLHPCGVPPQGQNSGWGITEGNPWSSMRTPAPCWCLQETGGSGGCVRGWTGPGGSGRSLGRGGLWHGGLAQGR